MRRRMRGMVTAAAVAVAGGLPALWAGGAARADVKLPALISDDMVIQENAPIRLWGWADDGEKVTATFAGQSATTTAQGGKWALTLPPTKAKAGGPYTLTISGKNTVTLKDVLVGEVWICSGQSNMEFPLSRAANAATEIPAADNPNLRLFLVKRDRADAPRDDIPGGTWQPCTPKSVSGFTAVGYFFGRDLAKARGVPIGLIATYWGGTPAESWTPETALAANPTLKPIIDGYPAAHDRYEKALAAYPDAAAKAQAAGKAAPRKPGAPWRYSELYNAMIAPLAPYSVAGATWYQGESNAGRAAQYRTLLPTMIQSWRQQWDEPQMSFLIVQLAPFMAIAPEPQESGWAELREAQEVTAATLPKAGMAVITDVGDAGNIHPTRKEPVGARLALLARRITYGEKIDAFSPSFRAMRVDGGKAVLTFDNVGPGLEARPTDSNGQPVPEGKLVGFAVAGADGKFVWADAKITGKDTVEVSSPQVPQPVAVRYGWANFPVVNLWSKDDLPAVPFRTDAPKDGAAAAPVAKE